MNSAVIIEEKPESGIVVVNGRTFYTDGRGQMTLPKPQDILQDEMVRKIFGFALALSAQISRFKAHTMADLTGFDQLMEQQYGLIKRGNKGKGNRSYRTINDLMRVTVQVADFISFGPELQVAKALVDECVTEWSADARSELVVLVTSAFETDREGQISRTKICSLLRQDIEDERWRRAMDAIKDAQRVVGRKEYVRFDMRDRVEDGWNSVTIDMANA